MRGNGKVELTMCPDCDTESHRCFGLLEMLGLFVACGGETARRRMRLLWGLVCAVVDKVAKVYGECGQLSDHLKRAALYFARRNSCH